MRTHFLLTRGELTWQYRRAVETAKVHAWEPLLWHVGPAPEVDCETRELDVPGWLAGASPQTVYDCLALGVLYREGGMVLGLDTISVRDATDLLGDNDLVVGSDWPDNWPDDRCEDPFNNHLLARPLSRVVFDMYEEARRRVESGDDRWGATGPLLLTEFVQAWREYRIGIAPFPALCGWEGSTIGRFYDGEQPGRDVRVIHLFSSAYPEQYATFDWRPGGATPPSPARSPAMREQPRLHLLSLPHTQTTRDYLTCAYTQKVVKFCRMMHPDWEIVLYAGEHNEAPCAEHVTLVTEAERARWFGKGFDTVQTPLEWDASKPYWQTFNGRAIAEISSRYAQGDLILLATGTQQIIANAFPGAGVCCEPFVGYEGIVTSHCAFESSSFMHTVYAKRDIGDGRDLDAVIPNFFDLDEFPEELLQQGGDYLLYVGRVIRRKGVAVAAEIAERVGMKLLVAGPGPTFAAPGRIVAPDITIEGPVEWVGELGVEARARMMAGAHALLAPTVYLEPFGGVAVEAQLCGTAAITTDFGAFRETVAPEFRFRNLQGALDAVERAGDVDSHYLRENAAAQFSLEAVRPLYEEWFGRIRDLWGDGWYQLRPTDAPAKVTA